MEAAKKPEGKFTYADYSAWPENERWELIDGVPYSMAAPSMAHQIVTREIFAQLHTFFRDKPCQVFFAPFSVRLNAGEADDTVVEPDILVVCDENKLKDGKSVVGAPDFIVEVLSPSTAKHDLLTKHFLYQRSGVREYWIADPDDKILMTYVLRDGKYSAVVEYYADSADVHIEALEGCVVNLADVFGGLI